MRMGQEPARTQNYFRTSTEKEDFYSFYIKEKSWTGKFLFVFPLSCVERDESRLNPFNLLYGN